MQEDWWPTIEDALAGARQVHAEQKRHRIHGKTSRVGNRRSDAGIDSRQEVIKVQTEISNTSSGR